jgi:AbrB family looped-hinge helix DNA binding protein
MRSIGIVRNLDGLGRVGIPIELRRLNGMERNDAAYCTIYLENEFIVIKLKETSDRSVRKLDELGRLVIPSEIRKNYLKNGDAVEFFEEDKTLYLKKHVVSCMCCDEVQGIKEINGVKLCKKHTLELAKLHKLL